MADQLFYTNNMVRNKTLDIIRQGQMDSLRKELDNLQEAPGGLGIEAYRKMVFDSYDKIAPVLNSNIAMHRQMSDRSIILNSEYGWNKSRRYVDNTENKRNIYGPLFNDLVSAFQNKQSTGQETMLKAVEFTNAYAYGFNERVQTSSSYKEVERSIKFLTEQAKNVVTFDIETFGGRNEFGKQQLDMITEFAFLRYDGFNKQAFGKDGNGFAQKQTGFVGIQEKDRHIYEEMIERYISDPLSSTEKDRITLNYLAKMGDDRMRIVEDAKQAGRFTVEASPDMKDVQVNESNLLKGLRRSVEIGRRQDATRLQGGLMQWEKDLADGILMIQDKKLNASVVGHNILQADIPWLNQFMANASDPFKNYMRGQGGSTSIQIGRHQIADTLPLLQHAMADNRFSSSYLDDNTRQLINELGTGPNALEVLANRSGRKGSNQASHTAEYDAKATLNAILTEKVGNTPILKSAIDAGLRVDGSSISSQLKTGRQQLFLATSSTGGRDFNSMLGFRLDPFDNQIYTSDGFKMDATGKKKTIEPTNFGEWMTKKGVTYGIDDIVELSSVDSDNPKLSAGRDYVEKMRKIHPALAVDDLVMVQFSAISDYGGQRVLEDTPGAHAKKNSLSSFIVGSRREVQSFFNNNMMLYAEKNEKGSYNLVKNAADKLQRVAFENEKDGRYLPTKQTGSNLIKSTIEDGIRLNTDDGAARSIRELNYTKFKNFLEFSNEIEKVASDMSGNDTPERKRVRAFEMMYANSQKVAEDVSKGKNVGKSAADAHRTFQEILGFGEGNKASLHPRTIDNALGMVDFVREMKPILEPIINEVDGMTVGTNRAQQNYLFAQAMDMAMHHMEKFNAGKVDYVDAIVRQADLNYYEIQTGSNAVRKGTPLGTMLGTGTESPLRVNLRSGEGGLIRKLEEGSPVKGDQRELKKKLMMLIDHEGVGNYIYGDGSAKDYLNQNSPYIVAKDLIGGLQKKREVDSRAGFITSPKTHTVTGIADVKAILNHKDFDSKNIVRESIEAIKTHRAGTFIDLPAYVRDESGLNRMSRDIVNTFLMDRFDEQEFRNMGYDDKGIKWLKETRRIREKDYTNMMKEILKGASAMDMSMRLDPATGSMSLQRGNTIIDLSDIPRERITDGVFYTQVGRNRIGPNMHVTTSGYGKLGDSNIELMSDVGKAMKGINWSLDKAIISAQKEGRDPTRTFQSYIRNIANELRTGSSVDMLDEQDAKAISHFYVDDLYNNLHRVDGIENIEFGKSAIAEKERQVFLGEIAKGKKFDFHKSDDAFKSIVAKHEKHIMSFVFNQVGAGEDKNFLLEFMSNRQKGGLSSEGAIKASIGQHELEALNSPMRAFESSARYLGIRESKALDVLKDTGLIDGDTRDRVYLGANLRTKLGQSRSSAVRQGLDEVVHTEALVQRAYVGSEEFLSKVYGGASTEAEKWASERIRTFGTIYEGSAVASSKLGDAFLQSYDHQRISYARKLFDEHSLSLQKIEEMKAMSEVVPEFKIGKDGKIEFEYRKGKYVKEGETLLREIGYGEKDIHIPAKYEGALRMGFFSKSLNVLATEGEVAKSVHDYAAEKGLEVKDKHAFMQVANELYNTDFYLERIDQNTYRKLHEDRAEKGMTRFAYAGLGDSVQTRDGKVISGDARISSLLNNLGLDGLKGRVLQKEFFDELTGNASYQGGFLRQMAKDQRHRSFTNNQFNDAVQRAGFKNTEEMRKVLTAERHELSTYLENQFDGAVYYSQTNDTGHKNVSRPISMAINNMFADEAERLKKGNPGLSRDEREKAAARTVADELSGVFQGKGGKGLEVHNGRLVVPELDFNDGSVIRRDLLESAYNRRMGDKTFDQLMTNANTDNFVSISTVQDYTGMTGAQDAKSFQMSEGQLANQKGFKISDREMIWMRSNKLHDDFIQQAKKALDPETFNNAFGFMTEEVGGKTVLSEQYRDRSMFDPFIEKIQKDIYAQNGDSDLIIDEKGEFVKTIKQGEGLPFDHKVVGEANSPYQNLLQSAKGLHSVYGGAVSVKAADSAYSIASNMQAIKFNEGKLSEADLMSSKQFGFQKLSLQDIDFTSGGDANFFLGKDSPANSIYGQNTIVDLSNIDERLLREAEIKNGMIAVGSIKAMPIGNEMMQRDPHKLLKNIRDNVEALRSGKEQGMYSANKIKTMENRIVEDLAEFNGALSAYTTGKESDLRRDLSEIRIEKSATAKASLLTLTDLETGSIAALRDAKVDGKSILDHHKDGALMDFRLVSKDHVRKMGLLDESYWGKGGLGLSSEEEMLERLRGGVQILGHRNPTIYEGSIKPMTMILSDHVKDTQVVDYAAGAVSAKEDADGDQVKSVLLSAKDSQGKNVDYLQYQSMAGKDSKLDEAFGMYKAQMYKNAIDVNPYYRDAVLKDMNEIQELDDKVAASVIESRSVTTKYIRPELSNLADEDLRQQYYNDYMAVESRALESYRSNTNYAGDNLRQDFLSDKNYKGYIQDAMSELDPDAMEHYGKYANAVDYYMRDMSFLASRVGSNKQAAAGQINLPLYKVRKVRNIAAESAINTGRDHRFLEHILEASEEAFLTPKHNEAKIVDNTMVVREFNEAFRSATGSNYRNEEAGTDKLVSWFEKNLEGRFKADKGLRELGADGGSFNNLSSSEKRAYYEEAAGMIQDIFSQSKNLDRLNLHMSTLAQVKGGVRPDQLQDALVYTDNNTSLLNNTLRALGEGHEELNVRKVDLLNHSDLLLNPDEKSKLSAHDWTPPTSGGVRETAKGLISGVQEKLASSNLKGKDLAFGALGIAGATMMLGFVGGNPSERSTTTAASGMEQDMYNIPVMTDDAVATMQSNPGQGYIININAGSPKGQKHAEEAIRQAMMSANGNANVNVAMNISNSGSNITDSTIQRMLEGVMGA